MVICVCVNEVLCDIIVILKLVSDKNVKKVVFLTEAQCISVFHKLFL
jgi:hypothetical protein